MMMPDDATKQKLYLQLCMQNLRLLQSSFILKIHLLIGQAAQKSSARLALIARCILKIREADEGALNLKLLRIVLVEVSLHKVYLLLRYQPFYATKNLHKLLWASKSFENSYQKVHPSYLSVSYHIIEAMLNRLNLCLHQKGLDTFLIKCCSR